MTTYYSTADKIIHQLRIVNGVRVWDVSKYFSQSHVRKNFGISYIEVAIPSSHKSEVIFHVRDEKAFLVKVLKYGF